MRTLSLLITCSYTLATYAGDYRPVPRASTANLDCESDGSWAVVTNTDKEAAVIIPETIDETTDYSSDYGSGSRINYDTDSDSLSACSDSDGKAVQAALIFSPGRPKPKHCCGCRFWR